MKKLFYTPFLAIMIFTSCQKEISFVPFARQIDPCKIQTAYYYGGGGTNDTASFIYTQDKLTSLIGSMADVLYNYDARGRVFSMAFYEKPGNLLYRIDTFYYANDSILSGITSHDYDMYNHLDTTLSQISFIYTGTQLSRLITIDSYPGVPYVDTLFSDFRWENGNVKSILFGSTGWADSMYYMYDSNPNYFNSTAEYFFMVDPFFQLHVGFDFHLPYFISKNNVSHFTLYSMDYPVTYLTDSLRHPLLVKQGGFDYMGYKWSCP